MRETIENIVLYACGVGMIVALGLGVRGFLQMRAWDREHPSDRAE